MSDFKEFSVDFQWEYAKGRHPSRRYCRTRSPGAPPVLQGFRKQRKAGPPASDSLKKSTSDLKSSALTFGLLSFDFDSRIRGYRSNLLESGMRQFLCFTISGLNGATQFLYRLTISNGGQICSTD